jgi:hypothetical protein
MQVNVHTVLPTQQSQQIQPGRIQRWQMLSTNRSFTLYRYSSALTAPPVCTRRLYACLHLQGHTQVVYRTVSQRGQRLTKQTPTTPQGSVPVLDGFVLVLQLSPATALHQSCNSSVPVLQVLTMTIMLQGTA